jgi:hypothetical protein
MNESLAHQGASYPRQRLAAPNRTLVSSLDPIAPRELLIFVQIFHLSSYLLCSCLRCTHAVTPAAELCLEHKANLDDTSSLTLCRPCECPVRNTLRSSCSQCAHRCLDKKLYLCRCTARESECIIVCRAHNYSSEEQRQRLDERCAHLHSAWKTATI